MCGYNKFWAPLQFHHIEPLSKDFTFKINDFFSFSDKIAQELDKCILLCATCHIETHEHMKVDKNYQNILQPYRQNLKEIWINLLNKYKNYDFNRIT